LDSKRFSGERGEGSILIRLGYSLQHLFAAVPLKLGTN